MINKILNFDIKSTDYIDDLVNENKLLSNKLSKSKIKVQKLIDSQKSLQRDSMAKIECTDLKLTNAQTAL